MISVLINLTFLLYWVSVLAGDSGVTQEPSVVWKLKGESAEMKCSHNKDAGYYQMYWFRQHPGESMELVVYMTTSTVDFGSFDKNKFSTVKEIAANGSLTVKDLNTEDSAAYFCAAALTPLHIWGCFAPHTDNICNRLSDDSNPAISIDEEPGRMNIVLITLTTLFISHRGETSAANNVQQTPTDVFTNVQKSTTLICSHSITSHEVMLWYKLSENKALQLLGYLNMHLKYPEESLKNKIELDGDGRNEGKLTIKTLEPDDSAVYFCAVKLDTVLQESVIYDRNLLLQSSTHHPPAAGFQSSCSTRTIKLHYSYICVCWAVLFFRVQNLLTVIIQKCNDVSGGLVV